MDADARQTLPYVLVSLWALLIVGANVQADTFHDQVQPILRKYCAGCHNPNDREAELSLVSYADLETGGENGDVIKPGDSAGSRLYALISGADEPAMPPADEPQLSSKQIAIVKRWIDDGATADDVDFEFQSPQLDPSPGPKPITAMAFDRSGTRLAVARYQSLDLLTDRLQLVHRLEKHPGKVNAVAFCADGRWLAAATGVTGLFGEAWLWDVRTGKLLQKLRGHQDSLYAVAISPDGQRLATGGYDRSIKIWDVDSGKVQRTLNGHNGPIFDLAFHPNGRVLASASGDSTIKIWDVIRGLRLDTRGEPLKEQFSVDVSRDGQYIVAGGADNRLRLWRLISVESPKINPLLVARYAHEQPIQRVRFALNDQAVVSVAADQTLKVWNTAELRQVFVHHHRGEMAQALAVDPRDQRVLAGRMDGVVEEIRLDAELQSVPQTTDAATDELTALSPAHAKTVDVDEVEPNDTCELAQHVELPAQVRGRIDRPDSTDGDTDRFRFAATQGEQWVIEVRAARDGSSLDSIVRVLDADGQPVPRVKFCAVRDSYFEFRGKDSTTVSDFRVHNWEEMKLNQLLYASGEVVKLYHYPRGPDSGFNVYPNYGSRHGYFETTPITHALHEPCYIVEPMPRGAEAPPTGLPTFTLHYQNDDDSFRRWERDSLLTFTAPSTGTYFVELQDVRRQQSPSHTYELIVRRPVPGFRIRSSASELKVRRGAGAKFMIEIERIDGFDGEVRLEMDQRPEGVRITSPLVIEAGQLRAWGTVSASRDAPEQSDMRVSFIASAQRNGRPLAQEKAELGPIHVLDPASVFIEIVGHEVMDDGTPVLTLRPGTTNTALIRVERNGHEGRVGFGKEDALINSPHGVFVSNTGLNGVLITETQTDRSISISVASWVQPTERWVFVEANVDGNPTSFPVLLRVLALQDENRQAGDDQTKHRF